MKKRSRGRVSKGPQRSREHSTAKPSKTLSDVQSTHREALVPLERIERTIVRVRGHSVIAASDLASIYGVAPRVLNQAVKRNIARFPRDFAFRLSPAEAAAIG